MPPLETGDRYHTKEFLRRHDLMPHVKKAELLENIVYMGSPVRISQHAKPDSFVQFMLSYYVMLHPECEVGGNGTWIVDPDTTVQPDSFLRYVDGQSSEDEDGYLNGAPELVVEVAASSVSIDNHLKKKAFERAGVREYIVWRVLNNGIDFWRYDDEAQEFRSVAPDAAGIWSSAVFPGLVLDVPAVLKMDHRAVISKLS